MATEHKRYEVTDNETGRLLIATDSLEELIPVLAKIEFDSSDVDGIDTFYYEDTPIHIWTPGGFSEFYLDDVMIALHIFCDWYRDDRLAALDYMMDDYGLTFRPGIYGYGGSLEGSAGEALDMIAQLEAPDAWQANLPKAKERKEVKVMIRRYPGNWRNLIALFPEYVTDYWTMTMECHKPDTNDSPRDPRQFEFCTIRYSDTLELLPVRVDRWEDDVEDYKRYLETIFPDNVLIFEPTEPTKE